MDVSEPLLLRVRYKGKQAARGRQKELLKQELGTDSLDLLVGKVQNSIKNYTKRDYTDDYFSSYYVLEKGYIM